MNYLTDSKSVVLATLARYRLIKESDRVLVGISGGPDSVALLHILHALRRKLRFSIGGLYINHRLRPRAANKEARFCKDLCARLRIPYYYEEIEIERLAGEEKTGIEETARNHRYRTLEQLAAVNGYDKIAVGHHRDDRVETILFNLIRGSGRAGFAGMPVRRGKIIRPLFDLSREQIIDYLKRSELEYMIDRSNLSPQHTRNRIRLDVLPLIEQKISPRASENILRFSEILAEEEVYLNSQTERIYGKSVAKTAGGKIKLDLDRFLQYGLWLRRRLVRRLLVEAGQVDIEFADIDRLSGLASAPGNSRQSVGRELFAEKLGTSFYLYRTNGLIARREVDIPGKIQLDYPRYWVSFEYVDRPDVKEVRRKGNAIAFVDFDKIEPPIYLSGLKRGGRFHPFGRPGTKKAGDFLTDIKYPRLLRDELPIVYDRRGIVWLAGVEIDDRVKIGKTTQKVVKLEIGSY